VLGIIHANVPSAVYDDLAMEIDELNYSLGAQGEAWHQVNCFGPIRTGCNPIHV